MLLCFVPFPLPLPSCVCVLCLCVVAVCFVCFLFLLFCRHTCLPLCFRDGPWSQGRVQPRIPAVHAFFVVFYCAQGSALSPSRRFPECRRIFLTLSRARTLALSATKKNANKNKTEIGSITWCCSSRASMYSEYIIGIRAPNLRRLGGIGVVVTIYSTVVEPRVLQRRKQRQRSAQQ